MGIPTLLEVLQEDREDLELMRGALECFVFAMQPQPQPLPGQQPAPPPSSAAWGKPQHQQQQPECGHQAQQSHQGHAEMQAAAVNAELFSRRQENVLLLLSLLEDEPVSISWSDSLIKIGHLLATTFNQFVLHCYDPCKSSTLCHPDACFVLAHLTPQSSQLHIHHLSPASSE
jgi:hypothetical protein